MVLEIVKFPAESLRNKAEAVIEINDEIKKLAADMIDTLYAAEGYGLAAPQVGKSLRMLVLDETGGKGAKNPQVFINPAIVEATGEMIGEEGCLSVPGEYAPVKRYARVVIEAVNEKGENVRVEATERLARIFQHEVDHLNGVLFLDLLPAFKRETLKKHIKRRIQSGDYVLSGQ